MDARVNSLTRAVKGYDPELYCARGQDGNLQIVRRTRAYEHFPFGGGTLFYSRIIPQVVLVLTDNWLASGRPVEWGIEPVMHRLQQIDAWNRVAIMDELERSYEKAKETADRDRRNKDEAWLRDNRSMFKRAFADINSSSLEKIDQRRFNGNR